MPKKKTALQPLYFSGRIHPLAGWDLGSNPGGGKLFVLFWAIKLKTI